MKIQNLRSKNKVVPVYLPHFVLKKPGSSELFSQRRESSLRLRRSIHQLVLIPLQYFLSSPLRMSFPPFRFSQHTQNQTFQELLWHDQAMISISVRIKLPHCADHHVRLPLCVCVLMYKVQLETLCRNTNSAERKLVGFIGPCSIWVCIFLFYFALKISCFPFLPLQKDKCMQIRKCIFVGFFFFFLFLTTNQEYKLPQLV